MRDASKWIIQVSDGHPKDRRFDVEFWQRQSGAARFAATWQLIVDAHVLRGEDATQLRLQRSLVSSRPASSAVPDRRRLGRRVSR
jgi:hypothetical protein